MIADYKITSFNNLKILKINKIITYDYIEHGIILKNDIIKNPLQIKELLSPDALIHLNQVHSDKVIFIKEIKKPIMQFTGDGLITDKIKVCLIVKTADCYPVFVIDKKNKLVGIIHCGRKGILNEIILKTIKNIGIYDTEIYIGPGIGFDCYKVNNEIIDGYRKKEYYNANRIRAQNGVPLLDLKGIIIDQLLYSGIHHKNIFYIDICSHCRRDLFYSFRQGDKNDSSRNYSYIFRKDR
ncbi:MAG: polyphenol oxidase family protein [Candidatus Hydrogenedentota bacterium]